MLNINIDKLDRIIDSFYKITGVMIGAYDTDFRPLSAKNLPHGSLCREVRQYDSLSRKCRECDIAGIKKCTGSMETQIYECHMGLVEAVTPVYADNTIAGYILIGQMLNEKNVEKVKSNINNLDDEIDKTAMLRTVEAVPRLSGDMIEAIISLMIICTKYLMVEKVIDIKSGILSKQIEEYIMGNMEKDIGIDDICCEMHISRSKLYDVSTEFFKMGITDYIRFLRIERAKRYLQENEHAVNQISTMVGIDDPNYFTKIFKRYTGMTPSQYKKSFA